MNQHATDSSSMKQGSFLLFTLAVLIGVLLTVQVYASERYEFFQGARAMGMGGASIAVVNDETSLLSNPAGLGKLRDFYGTIIDPELDGSSKDWSMYKTKAFSSVFDLSQVAATTAATPQEHYHMKAQIFPSLVVRNFGFGFFAKDSLDAEMDATGTSMQTDYTQDYGPLLGYNIRFWDGRIKLGFVGKYITRTEIHKALDPTQSLTIKDNAKSGSGAGLDVGLNLTAPWTLLPTLAVKVHDVGGTNFTGPGALDTVDTTKPDEIQQDADVAIAIFPIHSNHVRSAWTFEYHGVMHASDEPDKAKLYHFGGEVNIYDLIFIRAGYNQRYWTAGAELASEHFQFQFATYGEEIGTVDSPREDRRVVGKFAFRF